VQSIKFTKQRITEPLAENPVYDIVDVKIWQIRKGNGAAGQTSEIIHRWNILADWITVLTAITPDMSLDEAGHYAENVER
jgi:hypothetical protein